MSRASSQGTEVTIVTGAFSSIPPPPLLHTKTIPVLTSGGGITLGSVQNSGLHFVLIDHYRYSTNYK